MIEDSKSECLRSSGDLGIKRPRTERNVLRGGKLKPSVHAVEDKNSQYLTRVYAIITGLTELRKGDSNPSKT
jgi:hypothetical protein